MRKLVFILLACVISYSSAQDLKLKDNPKGMTLKTQIVPDKNSENTLQLKKRKTVSSYFGAGYSFMIFTNKYMSDAFPVLDTRNGSFLTNINLFIGFSVAKALTLEFEPTILFTSNERTVDYALSQPTQYGEHYAHTYTNNLLAFPLALNVRFFPFYKMSTSFARLFFLGAGAGAMWMREENEVFYNNTAVGYNPYSGDRFATQSSSQWAPMFRIMTGFTGAGGQFGFGGEVRYNIIPLDENTTVPFATRFSSNANSVDLTLRFYFSL